MTSPGDSGSTASKFASDPLYAALQHVLATDSESEELTKLVEALKDKDVTLNFCAIMEDLLRPDPVTGLRMVRVKDASIKIEDAKERDLDENLDIIRKIVLHMHEVIDAEHSLGFQIMEAMAAQKRGRGATKLNTTKTPRMLLIKKAAAAISQGTETSDLHFALKHGKGSKVDLSKFELRTIAEELLNLLNDGPPLFTNQKFQEFVRVLGKVKEGPERVTALRELVAELPLKNQIVAKDLFNMLVMLWKHWEETGMDDEMLAYALGPALLRSEGMAPERVMNYAQFVVPCCKQMIQHSESIFGAPAVVLSASNFDKFQLAYSAAFVTLQEMLNDKNLKQDAAAMKVYQSMGVLLSMLSQICKIVVKGKNKDKREFLTAGFDKLPTSFWIGLVRSRQRPDEERKWLSTLRQQTPVPGKRRDSENISIVPLMLTLLQQMCSLGIHEDHLREFIQQGSVAFSEIDADAFSALNDVVAKFFQAPIINTKNSTMEGDATPRQSVANVDLLPRPSANPARESAVIAHTNCAQADCTRAPLTHIKTRYCSVHFDEHRADEEKAGVRTVKGISGGRNCDILTHLPASIFDLDLGIQLSATASFYLHREEKYKNNLTYNCQPHLNKPPPPKPPLPSTPANSPKPPPGRKASLPNASPTSALLPTTPTATTPVFTPTAISASTPAPTPGAASSPTPVSPRRINPEVKTSGNKVNAVAARFEAGGVGSPLRTGTMGPRPTKPEEGTSEESKPVGADKSVRLSKTGGVGAFAARFEAEAAANASRIVARPPTRQGTVSKFATTPIDTTSPTDTPVQPSESKHDTKPPKPEGLPPRSAETAELKSNESFRGPRPPLTLQIQPPKTASSTEEPLASPVAVAASPVVTFRLLERRLAPPDTPLTGLEEPDFVRRPDDVMTTQVVNTLEDLLRSHYGNQADSTKSTKLAEGQLQPPLQPPPPSQLTIEGNVRIKAVWEIITTEVTYVNVLKAVADLYVAKVKSDTSPMPYGLTKDEVQCLFRNISRMSNLHAKFLSDLHLKFMTWTNDVETQRIGEVFVAFEESFRVYPTYVNLHDQATELLRRIDGNAGRYARFHQLMRDAKASPLSCGNDLASCLIAPIQRIPRYRLLLTEVLRQLQKTHPNHPDIPALEAGNAIVMLVAAHVNDSLRESERRAQMLVVCDELGIEPNKLINGSRYLMQKGNLTRICRKSDQLFMFYLFDDMLIYGHKNPGTETYVVNHQIPVDESFAITRIGTLEDHGKMTEIKGRTRPNLRWQIKSSVKSFEIYTLENSLVAKTWDESLGKFIKDEHGENSKPLWVQDHDHDACPLCSRKFTMVRRKHHCRACGSVCCGQCSANKIVLPTSNGNPERVCTTCFVKRNKIRANSLSLMSTQQLPLPAEYLDGDENASRDSSQLMNSPIENSDIQDPELSPKIAAT